MCQEDGEDRKRAWDAGALADEAAYEAREAETKHALDSPVRGDVVSERCAPLTCTCQSERPVHSPPIAIILDKLEYMPATAPLSEVYGCHD